MRYRRMHGQGWGNALSRRREKKVSNWKMGQQGEEEREKPPENSFLDLVLTALIICLFETLYKIPCPAFDKGGFTSISILFSP